MSPDSLVLLEASEKEGYNILIDRFFENEESGKMEHFQQFIKLKLLCLQLVKHTQKIKQYSKRAQENPESFLLQETDATFLPKDRAKMPIKVIPHPFAIGFVMDKEDYAEYADDNSGGQAIRVNETNRDLDSCLYMYAKPTFESDPIHEPLHLIYNLFSREKLFGGDLPIEISECPIQGSFINKYYEDFLEASKLHLASVQTECISYSSNDIHRYDMNHPLYRESYEAVIGFSENIANLSASYNPIDLNRLKVFFGEEASKIKDFSEYYYNTVKTLTDYFSALNLPKDQLIGMLLSTPMDKVDKLVEYTYWYAENRLGLEREQTDRLLGMHEIPLSELIKERRRQIFEEKTGFATPPDLPGMDAGQVLRFMRMPQYEAWSSNVIKDSLSGKDKKRLSSSLTIASEYYAQNEHLMEKEEITVEDVSRWMSEKIRKYNPCYHVALYIFARLICTEFKAVAINVLAPYLKEKLAEENPEWKNRIDMNKDYLQIIDDLVNSTIANPDTTYEELWKINFYTPPPRYINEVPDEDDIDDTVLPPEYPEWKDKLEKKGDDLPVIQDPEWFIATYESNDPVYNYDIPPIENIDLKGFGELDKDHVKTEIWKITDPVDDIHWKYLQVSFRELLLNMSVEELDTFGKKLSDNGIDEGSTISEDFDFLYYHRTGRTFFMPCEKFESSGIRDYFAERPFGRYSYIKLNR